MQKILERLIQLSDAEYRDFTKTLTPTSKPILGVRIPALRSLAKSSPLERIGAVSYPLAVIFSNRTCSKV